ncbi:MAG: aspartate carbamoyltransferase catalytic subunit, partial [Candidatus Subteraquimicrobiales bacterium]|nr:aspartate carbamoyltransferase catalytic subunit [Candidatus Subteraquimicrobiales bacterium]
MELRSKDLLGIKDLTKDEIMLILDQAKSFKEISTRTIKKVPALRGRTLINLFLEPSTRTRTSFELAGKRLSADVVNISGTTSAAAKGECLKDTAKTLGAMNADLVVIRHFASGAPHFLARLLPCGVINAGDGMHEHPTQALLDLFTINEKLNRIEGIKVAIVGDIAHSRVARSNILALNKMGASVVVVGPPTLIPTRVEEMGCEVNYDLDAILPEVDVVYVLRIQFERQEESFFPSLKEYATLFGMNMRRAELLKKDALIMHPGPMNRGIEITAEVADLPQSV